MLQNSKDYKICLKEALDNAKKRILLLDDYDKKWKFHIAPYLPPDFDQVKRRLS